jgi:hypothetical protein
MSGVVDIPVTGFERSLLNQRFIWDLERNQAYLWIIRDAFSVWYIDFGELELKVLFNP